MTLSLSAPILTKRLAYSSVWQRMSDIFEKIFFVMAFMSLYLLKLLSLILPFRTTTGTLVSAAVWTKFGQTSSSMSRQIAGLRFLKARAIVHEKSKGK